MQFLAKKIVQIFSTVVFFFYFLVMETMDPEPDPDPNPNPDSLEMLDPGLDSMNPVPQHWFST